jgi:hypothetical protein
MDLARAASPPAQPLSPRIEWVLPGGVPALTIALIGGCALDWGWTGFRGHALWDRLRLLLVPFVLPAALAWFSARAESEREIRARA